MNAPVQVAGHIPTSNVVLRIVGWIGVLGGTLLLAVNPVVATIVMILLGLCVLAAEAYRFRQRARRVMVTDTGDGFVIEDRHGRRSVRDNEVLSVSLRAKNHYSEGLLKSRTRVFTVKIPDRPAPIAMTNRVKSGEADPLEALVVRTIQNYETRAREALELGAVVSGKRWSFDKEALSVELRGPPERVPLAELAAIDIFDRKIKVWRRGSDEALLEIDVDSESAFLLHLLLSPLIADREQEDEETEGLGRVLFERPAPAAVKVIVWILALVSLAGGAFIFEANLLGVLIGCASLGICAALVVIALRLPRSVFRCHQRGVYKRSFLGERQLSYSQVNEFTYAATRQYYNGAYTGTSLSVHFLPVPGTGARPITFSRTVQAADEALDNLRDYISRVIAVRMWSKIAEGDTVRWTNSVYFEPAGIRYRPAKLIGRKDPVMVDYASVYGFDIDKGTFHLWEKGKNKSVLTISTSEPNFFPGYTCLAMMFHGGSEAEGEAAAPVPGE